MPLESVTAHITRARFILTPQGAVRGGHISVVASIGGLGTGATPQTADAHGGSGGVGISEPFPCLEGEQLGSVAGSQVVQRPEKALTSGYGRVKPSVSVCRKATT